MFLSTRQVKKYIRQGYDLNLISRIQPSNITFKENDAYWKQGDGYHKALHIPYDNYPENGLPNYWASALTLTHDSTVFRYFEHASKEEQSKQTQVAISNMLNSSNRNSTDDVDDQNTISSLLDFRTRLGNNIPSKLMGTSFYIAGDSEESLQEKARDLKAKLSQFGIKENDGMQDVEFHYPFVPAHRQPSLPTRRKGQAISVMDLGAGYPFNHTSLMDDRGAYLGQTRTAGAVMFNLLQEDANRQVPTLMIAGRDYTDKDKLAAKIIDGLFAKGHTIFNIDLKGTMKDLTEKQGGYYIRMSSDGDENHLNPMEVMATRISDDGIRDDQIESFRAHQSKLKVFAQMKDSSLTESDLNRLNTAVEELYEELDIWNPNASNINPEDLHVTDIVSEDYPVLGQLVEKLEGLYREKQIIGEDSSADSYDKLYNAFLSILQDYRFLNKQSNFEDLSRHKVVTFDLSGITDVALLNIQLYQILMLIASLAVKNGRSNVELIREGLELHKDQYNHTIVTISGADKIFDPRYAMSLQFLSMMIKSISSNYGAVILEVSSLQSILLSSNSSSSESYVLATRELFSEMRYRIFSQLDILTIPLLANALYGEMTESELEGLRSLRKGQFFLNIANVKNLSFSLQLSNEHDTAYYGVPYAETERYSLLK